MVDTIRLYPRTSGRVQRTFTLDNNSAECGMRPVALGRKNCLFVGSTGGGKAAAIAYTLSETAKLNGVDPQAWLTDKQKAASPDGYLSGKPGEIQNALWAAVGGVLDAFTSDECGRYVPVAGCEPE